MAEKHECAFLYLARLRLDYRGAHVETSTGTRRSSDAGPERQPPEESGAIEPGRLAAAQDGCSSAMAPALETVYRAGQPDRCCVRGRTHSEKVTLWQLSFWNLWQLLC
jgi:hypothetical protein